MRISKEKALELFKMPLHDLLEEGDRIRKRLHPGGLVTFVIDRNINYTNVCINRCSFCAFWRDKGSMDAYVLTLDEIMRKIEETVEVGGTQILLQGGINPDLELDFYLNMLRSIKRRFSINIHAFSPPEIAYLADRYSMSVREIIAILRDAGLDSIPGGGAEILSDRIRRRISPGKIDSQRWLEVMYESHRLGMKTTATMMFGSVEEAVDIVEHLERIRNLQDETGGFTAFIPWTFQPGNTALGGTPLTSLEYLRVLAISRIFLDNIPNIQASWVTQGIPVAQFALRCGANDFGSTMLEENVVSSTGLSHLVYQDFRSHIENIVNAIKDAGFRPCQRDTFYNIIRYFD